MPLSTDRFVYERHAILGLWGPWLIAHHQGHRQAGVDEDVGLATRLVGAIARLAPCSPLRRRQKPKTKSLAMLAATTGSS